MANGTQNALSLLGDQTYVDFVAVSQALDQDPGRRNNNPVTSIATTSTRSIQPATNSAITLPTRPRPTSTSISSATSFTRGASSSVLRDRNANSTPMSIAQRLGLTRSSSSNTDIPSEPPEPPPRDNCRKIIKQNSFAGETTNRTSFSFQDDGPSRQSRRGTWAPGEFKKSGVAIAKHSFIPITRDDLAFKKNDTLEIIEDGCHWWYARNIRTGQKGYVPSNHVQSKIPVCPWNITEEDIHDTLPPGHHRGRHLVTATRDFNAGAQGELSFKEGDVFLVMNTKSKWWFVQHIASGKEGFIPSNHVRDNSDETSTNVKSEVNAKDEELQDGETECTTAESTDGPDENVE